MNYCLCKFGSDTLKWVFHRGGGIPVQRPITQGIKNVLLASLQEKMETLKKTDVFLAVSKNLSNDSLV